MSAAGEAAAPGLCGAPEPCKTWSLFCRTLEDGRIVHLIPLMYTYGLRVATADANRCGVFSEGWCYAHAHLVDAVVAATNWDFVGDPPGPWIRDLRGRYGPGAGPRHEDDDEAAP
jgi:hypothetical protein